VVGSVAATVGDEDAAGDEMLANYITETRNLLNDSEGQFFREPTLINYINRSRRRIAYVSGCVRVVPPNVLTVPMQEVYPFSDWIPLVQGAVEGTQSILACRSVSIGLGGKWQNGKIVGGTWKPTWKRVPWTDFQARFRIYNNTFIGSFTEPGWWSQFNNGPTGAIYLAPIPSVVNPMEVDLTLIPQPLLTDRDLDPIPYPWQDAVCYWAAVMCLLQQQRATDAQAMAQLFNSDLPMCAAVVCPQMIANAYGATLRSA
jgi:hypothetical protein